MPGSDIQIPSFLKTPPLLCWNPLFPKLFLWRSTWKTSQFMAELFMNIWWSAYSQILKKIGKPYSILSPRCWGALLNILTEHILENSALTYRAFFRSANPLEVLDSGKVLRGELVEHVRRTVHLVDSMWYGTACLPDTLDSTRPVCHTSGLLHRAVVPQSGMRRLLLSAPSSSSSPLLIRTCCGHSGALTRPAPDGVVRLSASP